MEAPVYLAKPRGLSALGKPAIIACFNAYLQEYRGVLQICRRVDCGCYVKPAMTLRPLDGVLNGLTCSTNHP